MLFSGNTPLQEVLKKDFGSKSFVLSYSIDPALQNQVLVHTRELQLFFTKKANVSSVIQDVRVPFGGSLECLLLL